MGSAASTEGLYTMSVSQISLEKYSESEVFNTLRNLENEELVRYLNLYNCQTIRIKRRGLSGNDLLLIEENDLRKLGLVPEILNAVLKFRNEMHRLELKRLDELRLKNEAEEAARLEKNKREHEEMLRNKGIGDVSLGTSRYLSIEEKKRRDYVKLRRAISHKSQQTVEIHQMERKLQTMLANPYANVYDKPSQSHKKKSKHRKSDVSVDGAIMKNDVVDHHAMDHVDDKGDKALMIGGEEGADSNSSLADLAALDWCELRRHDFLNALDESKDILINEMDEMQLQLSRSNDTVHAIHTRAKLMRYVGIKKRKIYDNEGNEGDYFNPDIDLRLVKKYADYWSETEESESESESESEPELESMITGKSDPIRDKARAEAKDKAKAFKEMKRMERKIERDNDNTVLVRSEVTKICPDVEIMLKSQGKIVVQTSQQHQQELIPEMDKMSARRQSKLALLSDSFQTGSKSFTSKSNTNLEGHEGITLPHQYLKKL